MIKRFRFYYGLLLTAICLQPFWTEAGGDKEQPDLDVHHYLLDLQPDFSNKTLTGQTEITFLARKNGLKEVRLDLLGFRIDSIKSDGQPLSYQYNDTLLTISLAQSYDKADTGKVNVFYKGKPAKDPSGWGGFYFRNNVAFNLGVGFEAKPHNFGRAWFPCVDNFTDRAFYDFKIRTQPGKKAFCNGLLTNVDTLPNGDLSWHWSMDQSIPSYLASMAVGPYTTIKEMYQGINGKFPIVYAVKPGDTTRLKKGFQNIPKALSVFEEFYGPHRFPRVGYVSVPFNSGAMEHATNIAFPSNSLGKSTSNERLWAHELSHHWWGDLVTCHEAEEMWINEGWATFSEFLYLAQAYGDEAYNNAVRQNHYRVLNSAHIDDSGYRPLVPVPHSVTYGTHSYNKGADVVHTLRSYLGDSLFKAGIRKFLQENAFQAVTSKRLRDSLSETTGTDLSHFFQNWVFSPGFPHFALRDLNTTKNGNLYEISGSIQQKLHQAPELYKEVPLTITAFDKQWDTVNYQSQVTGKITDFRFRLNFEPEMLVLDPESRISDAKTTSREKIKNPKTINFNRSDIELVVDKIKDSALILLEKSWVQPDPYNGENPGYKLSDNHYWTIHGIFPDSFQAKANLEYHKRNDPGNLNLNHEDSFRVMYRPDSKTDWRVHPDYDLQFLGKRGYITINKVKKGEYCFAKKDHTASGLPQTLSGKGEKGLTIYPNPSKDLIKVKFSKPVQSVRRLNIYNINGKRIKSLEGRSKNPIKVKMKDIDSGQFILEVYFQSGKKVKQTFILQD